MAAKIQKKYSIAAAGELNQIGDKLTVTNQETGEIFDLAKVMSDFIGCDVKITCNYSEDIESEADLG